MPQTLPLSDLSAELAQIEFEAALAEAQRAGQALLDAALAAREQAKQRERAQAAEVWP